MPAGSRRSLRTTSDSARRVGRTQALRRRRASTAWLRARDLDRGALLCDVAVRKLQRHPRAVHVARVAEALARLRLEGSLLVRPKGHRVQVLAVVLPLPLVEEL